jgi:hypothetical protein
LYRYTSGTLVITRREILVWGVVLCGDGSGGVCTFHHVVILQSKHQLMRDESQCGPRNSSDTRERVTTLLRAELDMKYTLMNPGGQHLDTGHDPLPRMFLSLMVTWIFLMFAQGGHAFTWRGCETLNPKP